MLDLSFSRPLPEWLPDESLFSLLSRFHILSGNRLASDTCRSLFGHPHGGCEHDFPTRLGELCRRTQYVLGDARSVAVDRTLLPFYLPLRSVAGAEAAVDSLVGVSGGVLKFRLGILTSRFRANHPLKACPNCMDADRRETGTIFWRREHQVPGVWRCRSHGAILLESCVKSTGVERFGWTLPDAASLRSVISTTTGDTENALARLSELASEWLRLPSASVTVEHLAGAYRVAALEKYGPTALDASSRGRLSAAFFRAVEPLRVVPDLRALPASEAQATVQIQRWIHAPRGGTHPLRHLAIIFWLFRDWSHFLGNCKTATDEIAVNTVAAGPGKAFSDPREAPFLAAARGGKSISAAARSVGISTNTGIAWATRHGIEVKHRSKDLTKAERDTVIATLRGGDDKPTVARQCDVSIQSVTRILQSEIDLRDAWHEAQHRRRLEAARLAWKDALDKFDGLPAALIRCEAAAAYAWLYRNDWEWLVDHRPAPLVRGDSNRTRVDWDARDLSLSTEVRRVAAELAAVDGQGSVQLWQLYQVLPELKAKLGALDRLPLTLDAIRQTTRRRRATAKPQLF